MQPYFLPYIGYFQLIAAADVFVLYDNIKYTKKGWINRNRFLQNFSDEVFSLPLKKGSDSLQVIEREIAIDFDESRLLRQFEAAYKRAPFFEQTMPLLYDILTFEDRNLFRYIHHSIERVCLHLHIDTPILISSSLKVDSELKAQNKVLAICGELGAKEYLNPIGGKELYRFEDFASRGIFLRFLRPKMLAYEQYMNEFIPWLSIVDVLMFNSIEKVQKELIGSYDFE